MDDGGPTANIILFVVLILIDVFFYGFGAAITSLNAKEVERRAEEDKDKKSIRLAEIIGNPAGFVNTLQLIVSLINVIIGAFYLGVWLQGVQKLLEYVAGLQEEISRIPAEVIAVLSGILTMILLLYILLTFGILLPKKVAALVPEKWAYACITPVYYLNKAFAPFTKLVSATTNGIIHLFGGKADKGDTDVTEEEIINMVNEGHEQGVILASEAEMISNIFEYGDKEAQDIMVHRNSVIGIDGNTPLKDAISFMLTENYSRYPVYEENIDHIIGIIHLKDAMRLHNQDTELNRPIAEIEGLLRDAQVVPQTKNIDELFKEMQSKKLQMVVVIDEYGQTDGLLAMEDILEEIVGNIMDEYDEDTEYIEEKGNDEYLIEGKTPLEDLEERFGISFEDEPFETLNGFLIARLDRIPEEDEEFDVDYSGYNFKIMSVENKMITSVLVTKLPEVQEVDAECDETTLEESVK